MKILLVDDSRIARELTASYLHEMGHPVVQAPDGARALELYRGDPPDLVLLDVEMPEMNGYAVAREMRRSDDEGHWIPIIFLSGRVADEDVAKGLEAGGDDYMTKPVSPVVLRAKLSAMRRITDMQQRLREVGKQLQDVNRTLVKLSSLDGLTGIPNRRSFDTALEREWQRGMRDARPLALILGDVDFFKRYNDTYGHQSGDACLQAVAKALLQTARRTTDVVARFGGEEFAILLADMPVAGAMEVAARALESVRALQLPHASSDVAEYVTMSLGVSVCVPSHALTSDRLVEAADAALYRAKSEGRNRAAAQPLSGAA
ncbi:MAG TPA: diguanylate cyclase [Candidatus Limnocylindria bacterium]|jgi:diguanylate cyclase (GGDEF)-like protein|nr:diguanylate cyclase [Candidatus Limnocylindria bacterium]